MLHIYNTLSRREEPFETIEPGVVRMYVCGPTVYASSHIGHALSYIVFDVVRRYLEYKGFNVRHVQNFTDVDDKIINRSRELGIPWDELSARYSDEFLRDMDALNVKRAHEYPRASAVIEDIVADIARLIEMGNAYPLDGDVYFRVLSDPDYGKLSHRRLDEMNAGARVEVDERKEHPMDFALWKGAKPGEPAWDSPWGPGRPGWHIECTSMSTRSLGPQLDIHGGGNDLIFPHHENEIAQSEQLTGKAPFARYWMHNGWLLLNNEKMAKSEGNVLSIDNVVEKYGADAYRIFVLSSHYRRPLNFSEEAVVSAATVAERLATAVEGAEVGADTTAYAEDRAEFEAAMDDDFNTSRALAVLYRLATESNRLRSSEQDESGAASLLRELGSVLGLRLERWEVSAVGVEPFVDLLVQIRKELRGAKQFALADRVRDGLRELGVSVEDSPQGTKWRFER
ncbi:MAG: cysteine--tRNA ligase [Chloroflexota bacterium]|nr:cysteine--tRNA ligase [Chloroflexota bacterium]